MLGKDNRHPTWTKWNKYIDCLPSPERIRRGVGGGGVLLYMGFKQFTLETSLLYKPERLGLEKGIIFQETDQLVENFI